MYECMFIQVQGITNMHIYVYIYRYITVHIVLRISTLRDSTIIHTSTGDLVDAYTVGKLIIIYNVLVHM